MQRGLPGPVGPGETSSTFDSFLLLDVLLDTGSDAFPDLGAVATALSTRLEALLQFGIGERASGTHTGTSTTSVSGATLFEALTLLGLALLELDQRVLSKMLLDTGLGARLHLFDVPCFFTAPLEARP